MSELAPDGGWLDAMPVRLAAPPVGERSAAFRALSRLSRRFGRNEVPDLFAVLHQHPKLFWRWLFFAARLMPYGTLEARIRETLILRTAWNGRSRYEWGQHVVLALSLGFTDGEIVAIAGGPEAAHDPAERALLSACDELSQRGVVGDATWAALAERYDRKELIEILILIGHYQMLAGFLKSAGTALEPAIETELARFHQRIGR